MRSTGNPAGSRTIRRAITCLCVLTALLSAAGAAELPTIPERIILRDWLLLPRVGPEGRPPFPANPVTHAIVQGDWRPPEEGDAVPLGPGRQAVWTAMRAPGEGPLESEMLQGGWAYTRYDSDDRRRAILRAKGHAIAYVNGVPRVANVYRHDYVMIPIVLEEGANHFLFRCVRYGTIEARLEPATHDVMINMEDATLPEAVRGEARRLDAGIVVINTTTGPLDVAEAQGRRGRGPVVLPRYWMPPLSIAKLPVKLPARRAVGETITYRIRGRRLEPATVEVAVVEPGAFRNVTFLSEVEGSVQYYGYRPPRRSKAGTRPALMLHLHGAGDEAFHYRNHYVPKTWCAIASATNRRPFGFSWEDWGRVDAMEVLEQATRRAGADPTRIYLGGHSMGGHGVWINAGIFPDRFAAIGPGAGWEDIWSYGGATRFEDPDPIQAILDTSANPSRTALLANNYKQMGVLIIHGDADKVVPIEEAYRMRDLLEAHGHDDWTMVIEPGGGHVYDTTPEPGHSCFDLMELFEFFQRHARPVAPRRVDFTTVLPAVNDSCHWLRVEQQANQSEPSRAQLQLDPGRRWLFGTLDNVVRFSVDPGALIDPGELTVHLDEGEERQVEWSGGELHFRRTDGGWEVVEALDPGEKGPHRAGSVKTVLLVNRPILVVGTNGTSEKNAWALRKARHDNETMWYRGNASFPIVLDTDFDPASEPDRNVLLYGNADTNLAWPALLGDSPVSVRRGEARVGGRLFGGDDLACTAIRPRPGSRRASVAFLGGTGIKGMRALDDLAILYARIFRPDFAVFSADVWRQADRAVLATGFFGNDWSLEGGRTAFRPEEP